MSGSCAVGNTRTVLFYLSLNINLKTLLILFEIFNAFHGRKRLGERNFFRIFILNYTYFYAILRHLPMSYSIEMQRCLAKNLVFA